MGRAWVELHQMVGDSKAMATWAHFGREALSDADADDAVQRLGIDAKAWATEVRARVASAINAQESK